MRLEGLEGYQQLWRLRLHEAEECYRISGQDSVARQRYIEILRSFRAMVEQMPEVPRNAA